MNTLPVGKLPLEIFSRILEGSQSRDPRVLLGPGIGLDCAVIDNGPTLLVFKSDPITFASQEIGWYLVQVNANDIATTGAVPRWLLVTALLPGEKTTPDLVEGISRQLQDACREINVTIIGGHTEITHGLDRPILAGTLIGEVERESLVTPRGARPGDRILLTKGVPIEATAILAREFPSRLRPTLNEEEIHRASQFLYNPGISVLKDARIALQAGKVTAMHDPTEGGLATALWELAEASGRTLSFDPSQVPIPSLSARVCQAFDLDPLASIASGALLLTCPADDSPKIQAALEEAGIPCAEIGEVRTGPPRVQTKSTSGFTPLPRPPRDAIARIFDKR